MVRNHIGFDTKHIAWVPCKELQESSQEPKVYLDLMMTAESTEDNKRLLNLLALLQIESGVLDRMIYKNKNQHCRSPYFQFLLKVRRDLRLLQYAGLGEILKVVFSIVDGIKPAQNALYHHRSKFNSSRASYKDRLLGVARLLSNMVEPMLKAATQISLLLAKSFFMGFCITVLALLARLRGLVQQMLQDVILLFNKVPSPTAEKQSVKLSQGATETFREFYPSTKKILKLECVWKEDKFYLLERTETKDNKNGEEGIKSCQPVSSIEYETLELFNKVSAPEHCSPSVEENTAPLRDDSPAPATCTENKDYRGTINTGEPKFQAATVEAAAASIDGLASSASGEPQTGSRRKVVFVSVKRPNPSDSSAADPIKKMKLELGSSDSAATEDPFLNLLFSGKPKNFVLES